MLTRLQYAQVNRALQPNEVKYIPQATATIPAIIKRDFTSNTKQNKVNQKLTASISALQHIWICMGCSANISWNLTAVFSSSKCKNHTRLSFKSRICSSRVVISQNTNWMYKLHLYVPYMQDRNVIPKAPRVNNYSWQGDFYAFQQLWKYKAV